MSGANEERDYRFRDLNETDETRHSCSCCFGCCVVTSPQRPERPETQTESNIYIISKIMVQSAILSLGLFVIVWFSINGFAYGDTNKCKFYIFLKFPALFINMFISLWCFGQL